jgi:hypothetical protein
MTHQQQDFPVLELVECHKLWELLGREQDERLEGSGVCTAGDAFYVIFDNTPDVGRIGGLPPASHPGNRWIANPHGSEGYEDLAFDPEERHFYVLVEALEQKNGRFYPVVDEYDANFTFLERRTVDFEIESENKGFESAAFAQRDGEGYLLLMCEGNFCLGGKRGRTPGGGRIQVFRKGKKRWKHVATLKLPEWVPFADYSGMEVLGDWVVVLSQEISAVWAARFTPEGGFLDEGRVYLLPRDGEGSPLFCNAEGIAWAGENTFVVVTDKFKAGKQPGACAAHDQSFAVLRVSAP